MHLHPPEAAHQTAPHGLRAVDVVRCFEAALAWGAPAVLWHGEGVSWVALGAVSPDAGAVVDPAEGTPAEGTALPIWVAALPFDDGHPHASASAHPELPLGVTSGRWRPALVLAADGRRRVVGTEGVAWLHRLRRVPPANTETRPWGGILEPIEDRTRFEARVASAAARCDGDPLHKLVLARTARARPAKDARFSVGATLRALIGSAGTATVFAVVGAGGTAFLGASPETLVRVRGRHLQTTALAGTRALGSGAHEALLSDPKEQVEHAAVVTGIRAALAPITESVAAPSGPSIRRLPGMLHLETPITARLSAGISAWDAVAALHPTPALGGWPRAEALAWLRAHEADSRGLYAGPVGWVADDGSAHFVVGIRSAWVSATEATLFAGAGVVARSQPDAEWRETALKLETIRGALCTEVSVSIDDHRQFSARGGR